MYIQDESIDLVYLDPPFKSNQDYNVLFSEKNGSFSKSQIKVFGDTWHWTIEAEETYQELVMGGGRVSDVIQSFRILLGENDMMAYLSMMAIRLQQLHRVLKPTGSIYLHCDPTASHYLKLLMDAVFEPTNFRNEIIWRRTGNNKSNKRFGPLHQTILFYAKSESTSFYPQMNPYTKDYIEKFFINKDDRGDYQSVILTGPGIRNGESGLQWRNYNPTKSGRHWQPASYLYTKYRELTDEDLSDFTLLDRLDKLDEVGLIHWGKSKTSFPRYKFYLSDAPGIPLQDIWAYQPGTEGCIYENPDIGIDQDVKWLMSMSKERLDYPTQKPEGLLRRIINSSSVEGQVVLDPFCGCGTTISVAQQLNRKWIGIDITHLAIALIKHRLNDAYGNEVSYKVIGEPCDISGAKTLASQDPYQFQWWALGLVGARPTEQKKGADKGIDGRIYFFDKISKKGKPNQIIISVKAGKVGVSHVRDLRGVIERENATIGVLISMNPPTSPMIIEAASASFYTSLELGGKKYPKIQLLTISDILAGKNIEYPSFGKLEGNATFKKAPKAEMKEDKKYKQQKQQILFD